MWYDQTNKHSQQNTHQSFCSYRHYVCRLLSYYPKCLLRSLQILSLIYGVLTSLQALWSFSSVTQGFSYTIYHVITSCRLSEGLGIHGSGTKTAVHWCVYLQTYNVLKWTNTYIYHMLHSQILMPLHQSPPCTKLVRDSVAENLIVWVLLFFNPLYFCASPYCLYLV